MHKAELHDNNNKWFVVAAALCAVVVATVIACRNSKETVDEGKQPSKSNEFTAAEIATCNQGVAEMGQFKPADAIATFQQLLAIHPDSADLKVNLAIAVLNRLGDSATDAAEAQKLLEEVLEKNPDQVRAQYCLGLIKLYNGDQADALRLFEAVHKSDPYDAYAAYYIGYCRDELRKDDAIDWYNRAIKLDPYLRSVPYRRSLALFRKNKTAEAKIDMALFEKLKTNPQARVAEFKYTRMGPKASVVSIDVPANDDADKPASLADTFLDPVDLAVELPQGWQWAKLDPQHPSSLTVCDVDHNGTLDLLLTRSLDHDGKTVSALLLQDDQGFHLAADHPLSQIEAVNAALWGDFDNDGLNDVYLCRQGENQLWRQFEAGKWQDVTQSTHTAGEPRDTVDGALFDADHDGDLDIYAVNADGPNELFSNNLDGTFRPLGAEQGIAGDGRPSRQVLIADLDNDRDADMIVIHNEAPHEIFINDLLWNYHAATNADALQQAEIAAIVAIDSDADGAVELISATSTDVSKWVLDGEDPKWSLAARGKWSGEAKLALADPAGNGRFAIVASTAEGAVAFNPLSSELSAIKIAKCSLSAVVNLQGGQGPAIVALRSSAPPQIARSKAAANRFVWLSLTGTKDKETMRSNRSGIGAQLAMRVGSRWTATNTFRHSSGPGQSLMPLALGTAGATGVDFVAINWSDGVFQTERSLDAGKLYVIEETQRQSSSCPVLFAWNGREYGFVTDCLGVGGIGFALGRNDYAPVRPFENLLLPEGLLQPKDGRYELKLTEPMEEACYLDSLRLVAYDLPPGWQMTLDERMATGEPEVTGEARFYRAEAKVSQAVNDRGQDVTTQLQHADLQPAPPGPVDVRFIGRCAEHWVTLTFAEPIDRHQGLPLLLADGWLEYPYSQTMFAAWQAGASYDAPSVEARAPGGEWVTVLDRFGYPAGMPRQMSVPLRNLPMGTRELRIRTTQEVYWDRLSVVWAEECPDVRRLELPMASARVEECGFPLRYDTREHAPQYNFSKRKPLWDMRHLTGFYTALGACEDLVTTTDDAVAIFGPGEQIATDFTAPPELPSPGFTRRFVLEAAGWCKDMDLYTKTGNSLEPLPRRGTGTVSPRRDALHERYHTRYRSGQ